MQKSRIDQIVGCIVHFTFKVNHHQKAGKNILTVCLMIWCSLSVAMPLFGQLDAVDDFTYQLQDVDLAEMGASAFDLVIMDYSSDGCEEGEYSESDIIALKNSAGGPKIVLAYMSIGETESYRFYWQNDWEPGNPLWLDEENPEWPENYKVFFWQPEWQAIIFEYLSRIQNAGFDGVYLDIIDAYEYYATISSVQTTLAMVQFVQSIRDTARNRNPSFLIFVQNGAELASIYPAYLNAVDGIGQEDLYYGYEGDGEETPSEIANELESHLNIFHDAGKTVLSVNYPFAFSESEPHFDAETMAKIDQAYQRSRANGYIPYCTVRELCFLTVIPGYEPAGLSDYQSQTEPADFHLLNNYPNPFNGTTVIPLRIDQKPVSGLSMRIINIRGETVRSYTLPEPAGQQLICWDGCDETEREMPGGIYLIRVQAGNCVQTGRMTLCK